MLTKANKNIISLIQEVLYYRRNMYSMYCCFYAQRENNNYTCDGDTDEGVTELKCSECKDLYWEEVEKSMLEKYIIKEA